jgi:hypothetical protein
LKLMASALSAKPGTGSPRWLLRARPGPGCGANGLLGEIAVQPNEATSSCRCEEPDVQRRSVRCLRNAAQEIDLLIERTAASK